MLTKITIGAVALSFLIRSGVAQTPPAVPSQYQDAYNAVNSNLTSFQTTINSAWNGTPSPLVYSSQLQTVNSDLTTNLLGANYYPMTVLSELNSLQALGVRAITFHINFPALLPSYYTNAADYQAYVNFYTTLVSEIRSRGLKVIIENTIAIVYPSNNSAGFIPYYQSLDWPTYMNQRAQLAANIANLFHPDYLVLVAEPDTEANSTFQANANTVAGSTQMVQGMISAVKATGATSVKLGAGSGTWNPSFMQYIQSFSTLPLDFVDMHVYPVNKNNLPNALNAVNVIKAAGKQPTMSEMWAYKESDAEYTSNSLSYTTVYARDVFSFWTSTDIAFLQTMSKFANFGNFIFMTPFWSHNLAAYLDYNTCAGQSDSSLILAGGTAATAANMVGAFTTTGLAWENLVITSPDNTPPVVPAPPALKAASQTATNLVWTPTTDNIGVAAYNIYRNGALAGTVSSPLNFYDTGLSASTTYSYSIAAFDAAGNLSQRSAPLSVTTLAYPDKTPPTTPAGVSATPFSDTLMNLAWTPSSDNVAVSGYEIYRGTSPASITPYSTSTVNSFLDLSVAPSKTYYYQIDAYDTSGNHSPRSTVITATTNADTTPPTAPGNVTVVTQPGAAVISWTASTDDYMIGAYQVYRGLTSSSLQLIGGVVSPALTYTDTKVTSGKTYYYAVAATDVSKNLSTMSPQVVVTAP